MLMLRSLRHSARPVLSLLSFAAAALLLSGCASPGNPRPPSLKLPEPVSVLTAERQDGTVRLGFAVPAKTTDGLLVSGPVKAELCRAVADNPCRATESFPVARTVTAAVEWVDVLPTDLNTGDERKLTYKVQLLNAAGKTAGWSEPAFAASGTAPSPVESLRAEGFRGGIGLRWSPKSDGNGEVEIERRDLRPAMPKGKSAKGDAAGKAIPPHKAIAGLDGKETAGKGKDTIWLHASAAKAGDVGGTVDASAVMGVPYRYVAVRSRTVTLDGIALELRSSASAAVDYTLRDVYPPDAPEGLTAAEFSAEGSQGVSVDLIWQPSREHDLAGYAVYRQTVSAGGSPLGAPEKLTAKLLSLPSFRDLAAARAQHYRYTVTATDTAGNTSAASAAVDVQTAP